MLRNSKIFLAYMLQFKQSRNRVAEGQTILFFIADDSQSLFCVNQ